ncbi:unnamed protein product [Oppiella nova]|uniref:Uncharacterized protein n=1 Tax=Oppiella nova TaxID=334625 RepID=A0A7R9QSG2_9ACAR|nr:unnamed protein product [Oppiella nova]CAG2174020.1 unnamed protein product [Oppiella nova]
MGNKLFRGKSHTKYDISSGSKSDSKESKNSVDSAPVAYIQTEVISRYDTTTKTTARVALVVCVICLWLNIPDSVASGFNVTGVYGIALVAQSH